MLVSREETWRTQVDLSSRERGWPAELVIEYTMAEPKDEIVYLYKGLNMVSLPVEPDNPAAESVLSGILDKVVRVWTYDPDDAADPWRTYAPGATEGNTLQQMNTQRGYWIEMRADADIQISGAGTYGGTLQLRQGWNFVGYPSQHARPAAEVLSPIADKVKLVWYYDVLDPADPWKRYLPNGAPWGNDLVSFEPKRGYWIEVTQDCQLTIQ
jgi:hypothetical protein